MIHVISARSWAKLSKNQQEIVRAESKSAGQRMRVLVASQEDDQIKKLADLGMAVARPDINAFKSKMQPAYDKIGSYLGVDNVKIFQEIASKIG